LLFGPKFSIFSLMSLFSQNTNLVNGYEISFRYFALVYDTLKSLLDLIEHRNPLPVGKV